MEAANMATSGNQVTLHTTEGCSMQFVKRRQSGEIQGQNCFNGTRQNEGCGVRGTSVTFGAQFNENGGGVYALEIRPEGIRVWHFSRDTIPTDLAELVYIQGIFNRIDPSEWGTPLADFPNTECPIEKHFRNQSITVDIGLCDRWAGTEKYNSTEDQCPDDCLRYVTEQPGSVYKKAYWEFGGWWVLQAF